MATYAGVDLGASNVRSVVGEGPTAIAGRDRRETPAGPDGAAVTAAVQDSLRAACDRAALAPGALAAVGVGSMGPLAAGGVVEPPNLPAVDRVALRAPLADLVDAGEVHVVNDAVAGVIGERAVADAPLRDVVYLTISTGLGAGACVDGHVLTGRAGNAAEVGHFELDPAGRMTCGCGGAGHWEAYCSGRNLPRYARELYDGEATALPIDGDLTAAAIYDAAGTDQFATRIVERATEWTLRGAAGVVQAFAPARLVVGGAVALENPRWVVDPIGERLADRLAVDAPTVATASLGHDAVAVGALVVAVSGGV